MHLLKLPGHANVFQIGYRPLRDPLTEVSALLPSDLTLQGTFKDRLLRSAFLLFSLKYEELAKIAGLHSPGACILMFPFTENIEIARLAWSCHQCKPSSGQASVADFTTRNAKTSIVSLLWAYTGE